MKKKDNKIKACVTGLSIHTSIGHDLQTFSESMEKGLCGISTLTFERISPTVCIGAPLVDPDFKDLKEPIPGIEKNRLNSARKICARASAGITGAVTSSLQAWAMSHLDESPIDPKDIGLIVTGSNLTTKLTYNQYCKHADNIESVNPRYALNFMDTDYIGTISEIMGIKGGGFVLGGASASGLLGIIEAFYWITSGRYKACLVCGTFADFSPIEMQAFINIGAMGGKNKGMAPEFVCRPFDRDHNGFILGQGIAAVIIESSESAQERGVMSYVEIVAGAMCMDGNRLSNPSIEGEIQVMKSVIQNANITPDKIGLINTHGTSSPLGDITEIKAINHIFKDSFPKPWINSTKSLIGHCLWSAGIVEFVASAIQLRNSFMHPNLNLINPIDGECRFVGEKSINEKVEYVLKNSFGFGGINASVILR